jgi:hypothetical protein
MPETLPVAEYRCRFTQECLTCHEPIYEGTPTIAGALSHFTKDFVWMHPRCATWYRATFGTRFIIDDGWRILTMQQRCKGTCAKFIVPGEKAYRRWRWLSAESDGFELSFECHGCHRARNGEHVLASA